MTGSAQCTVRNIPSGLYLYLAMKQSASYLKNFCVMHVRNYDGLDFILFIEWRRCK